MGAEIAVADMPKLFVMFQQQVQRNSLQKKAPGLGLAISKALVEEHQCYIGVTSDQAKGTTFWFEL